MGRYHGFPLAHLLNLGCLDYQTLALSFTTRKKYLINRLGKELEKLYVDQWENERQNTIGKQQKSKLELYSNIKSSYRRETYIDVVRDIHTQNALHKLDCLLINFQLNKGDKKMYPESNEYATYVVTMLLEMNFITYLYAMNSLLHNADRLINDILKVNTHFIKFDKNLFDYILSLCDCSIFDLTVLFIKDIMENHISAISKLQN